MNVFARGFAGMLLLAASAAVLAEGALPPEQQQGEVRWRAGGIGIDESTAMRAVAPAYPLVLIFAAHNSEHGYWAADVDVAIRDAGGSTVLQTVSDGPILLAHVPPGRYEITATYAGQPRVQTAEVVAGQSRRVDLAWDLRGASPLASN